MSEDTNSIIFSDLEERCCEHHAATQANSNAICLDNSDGKAANIYNDSKLEERSRKELEDVLQKIQTYLEKKKVVIRDIIRTRESIDQRTLSFQSKEKELSEILKKLKIQNEALQKAVKTHQEEEELFQKTEQERRQREGHPEEIEKILKIIEEKAKRFSTLQTALDEHMRNKLDEPFPIAAFEKLQTSETQMEELSDFATIAIKNLDKSHNMLLSCVPTMQHTLILLRNKLEEEIKKGDELKAQIELVETKFGDLGRGLESLVKANKQAALRSDVFQCTIRDLQKSVDDCRVQMDKSEKGCGE